MRGVEAIPGDDSAGSEAGTLILAATPIGRSEDASARLVAALATAPVIAAEDTRRLRRLAGRLGVEPGGNLVSYWEDNEQRRGPELLTHLRAGRDVLLVTDAGMPGVSDPGYRLTSAAVAEGIPVTVLPGPSAVTAALAVSGLPSDRFCFEGFPPRGQGERNRRFTELAGERRTMVLFESPRRIGATLKALAAAFGGTRRVVVCRELTKTHEEIRRGTLDELAAWATGEVRGEITVVVAGAPARTTGPADVDEAVTEVSRRVAGGMSQRDAVAAVAAEAGLSRRLVYKAVVSPSVSS